MSFTDLEGLHEVIQRKTTLLSAKCTVGAQQIVVSSFISAAALRPGERSNESIYMHKPFLVCCWNFTDSID